MCHIGSNADGVKFFFRKLCLDVESAYGVDFIAEKVDAVRKFVAVAENVKYGTTVCEMARLIDIIDLAEIVVSEPFYDFCKVNRRVEAETEGVLGKHLWGSDLFGKSLGVGDYNFHRRGG